MITQDPPPLPDLSPSTIFFTDCETLNDRRGVSRQTTLYFKSNFLTLSEIGHMNVMCRPALSWILANFFSSHKQFV